MVVRAVLVFRGHQAEALVSSKKGAWSPLSCCLSAVIACRIEKACLTEQLDRRFLLSQDLPQTLTPDAITGVPEGHGAFHRVAGRGRRGRRRGMSPPAELCQSRGV